MQRIFGLTLIGGVGSKVAVHGLVGVKEVVGMVLHSLLHHAGDLMAHIE